MISRRHIRLKVMQSLYAFFISKNKEIEDSSSMMIQQIKELTQLQLVLLSFLIEITDYADIFFDKQRKKYLPETQDLNPNKKFTNNLILKNLKSNKRLIKRLDKVSLIWQSDDYV